MTALTVSAATGRQRNPVAPDVTLGWSGRHQDITLGHSGRVRAQQRRSDMPASSTQSTRDDLIARYRQGYAAISEALSGITPVELDACEAPGEWSPREIVHHLADSEMTSAIRLRLLVAENSPHIVGYDQEEFARRLFYDRPIEPSLAAFKAARESTADILERMTEEDWSRQGSHSESGAYSVMDWMALYATHAHDHADQIRRARAAAVTGTETPAK